MFLWCGIVISGAWAETEAPVSQQWQQPGILYGTRLELAARSQDLENQALRVLVDMEGGTRLYLHTTDEEQSPPTLGISSENLRAGPVLLNGLHRALRSPTGHGPGSSVWVEASELRPDFSFEPSSRHGLELSYRRSAVGKGNLTRVGFYGIEEAQGVAGVGVSLRHESGPYVFETLTGLARPPRRPSSEDWFLSRREFPGGCLSHSVVSAGLRTGVLDARAAGGLSYGSLVRSGGWGRGVVTVHGRPALLQLLGAVSSPDYRGPDGRTVSIRRYTDMSLRIPGEGPFSVHGGIAARSGQVPFSVHETGIHRREFRTGVDYEGQLVRLSLTAKGENLRNSDQERTRHESMSIRVESGAFGGDGLRGMAEHRISRRLTADEVEPGYDTVSQLGLRYKVPAVRLELDLSHRNHPADSFRVRGASYISHGDWSGSVLLSSELVPSIVADLEQNWSVRLELRRVLRFR